jgi:beta-glucanase (GH16 family)
LPTGLTLSNSGIISGTPSAAGTFNFITKVTDSAAPAQSATQADGIVVAASTQLTAPPQAAGYNLSFSDEFTSLNLSPDRKGDYTWYEGLWWNSTIPPASDISASGSILTLNWENGQGSSHTDVIACSTNAMYCHAFRYGYFEARMKWDPTTGSWPAFWLMPKEDITGQNVTNGVKEVGEIDIFEGQGANSHTFYGTIHDWQNDVDVANNEHANSFQLASTVDLTQYHTYGILWVPGKITWYFDNQPLFSAATYAIFDQQNYYPILSSQEGVNWSYGNMTGVTASTIPLNVDWIHVWQQ